jgi:small subunit ribosomal protein S8
MPHSKIKEAIARILSDCKMLESVDVKTDDSGFKILEITITKQNQSPAFTEIVRNSRPGRRQYVKVDEIPTVKGGRGIVILSTSKGVMSGREAKQKQLGGELICAIY